jgi:GNAT superfamily N-acetyltransferase
MTRDDTPEVAQLVSAYEQAFLEEPDVLDPDEVATWWRELDLATDSLAFLDAHGRLSAYVVLYRRGDDALISDGYVHPEHHGRGLGSVLVEWLEEETRRRERPVARSSLLAGDRAAASLFEGRGFEAVRHFYRMMIDLDSPPTGPDWPEGFEVFSFQPGDEEAIHAVIEEGFADHWGHEAHDLEHWQTTRFDQPWWDPSLVYLVRQGSEVVAGEVNAVRFGGGWIGHLATRKPWRGKGLGRALLLHAFAEFHRRGDTRISLAVDSQNETGATALYESVGMRVGSQWDVWEKRL